MEHGTILRPFPRKPELAGWPSAEKWKKNLGESGFTSISIPAVRTSDRISSFLIHLTYAGTDVATYAPAVWLWYQNISHFQHRKPVYRNWLCFENGTVGPCYVTNCCRHCFRSGEGHKGPGQPVLRRTAGTCTAVWTSHVRCEWLVRVIWNGTNCEMWLYPGNCLKALPFYAMSSVFWNSTQYINFSLTMSYISQIVIKNAVCGYSVVAAFIIQLWSSVVIDYSKRRAVIVIITSAKEDMFLPSFVCVSNFCKNFQRDLHEIFCEGWQWANEQYSMAIRITIWIRGLFSGSVNIERYGNGHKSAAHTE